jgi:hypothetical protein
MGKPSINDLDELNQRLNSLEQSCRRWRWVGIASVLALVCVVTAGALRREEVPKVIRAGRFVAVDETGRETISVRASGEGKEKAKIEFFGPTGKRSLAMGLRQDDRPFVVLSDPDQKLLLVLDIDPGFGPGVSLRNLTQSTGLQLGVSPEGLAGLGVMGEGGIPILNLGMTPDGSALMAIRDKKGKELLRLPKP